MNSLNSYPTDHCKVAIVGGGPSGLAAATQFKKLGIGDVIVLEREAEAGGIPRHCGHPPFGMREFYRVMTGPRYARALVKRAQQAGVDLRTKTSVIKISTDGILQVSNSQGISHIKADRIIIATGVREKPRSARLVSGARPLGISTVGALQSMIYLKNQVPFKRPVIVGSELVSFSAIWTCFGAGIKPVMMLERTKSILTFWPARWLPALFRIPLLFQTKIVDIKGKDRVTGVTISDHTGKTRDIECDGVVFSGQFLPESSLARAIGLDIDSHSGGPVINQYGRCSNPIIYATGNLLRPLETAGWCWREGTNLAKWVAADIQGKLPQDKTSIPLSLTSPLIKLAVPQRIQIPCDGTGMKHIQIRFTEVCKGQLTLRCEDQVVWQKSFSAKPEVRVLIPLKVLEGKSNTSALNLDFQRTDTVEILQHSLPPIPDSK